MLAYFLYVDRGGNQYGPRYYFEAFPFVVLAWHARSEARVVAGRSEPYRLVAEHKIDRAIVFVASRAGWTRPMRERDLTRNDPDFADTVLYVHDRGRRTTA